MSNRQGFALLATLGLVVMLTAAAAAGAETAWTYRRATLNRLEGAAAEAAARGGAAHAEAILNEVAAREARAGDTYFLYPSGDAWRRLTVALADTIVLADARYAVQLTDAGARLHLNLASEEELRQLFVSLRVDAGRADRVAQAIADWRDADEFRRGRGAETADYLARGARMLPRNGAFGSVRELRDVAGVDAELFDRVEPFLTVRGSGVVNLNAAAAPVMLSLPGMGDEAVTAILRARDRSRPLRGVNELQEALSPNARARLTAALPQLLPRITFATREVLVTSVGSRPGSAAVSTAEVLLVVDGRHVFRTAEWIR